MRGGPETFRFVLPPPALPASTSIGDLLALRWDGEMLLVDLVDEPSASANDRAVTALRSAFDHLVTEADLVEPDIVEAEDLTAVARIDHGLFVEPSLPVTELAERAGLSVRGDHLALADHDWVAWSSSRLQTAAVWTLARRHGLDPDEATLLMFALGAVDREHAFVTGEIPGASEHPGGPTTIDPPIPDEQLRMVLAAASDPAVAAALVDETAYDHPELVVGLRALAARLARAASGRERAIVHYLLACAAEAVGEVEEAATQARRAVQADPHHGGAVWLATRYASLRGRAAEALRHLTAIHDPPPGDHLGDLLRRHAGPGPTDAPRNAPCPCGSGRKHKVCCGPTNGWPLSERVPWLLTKLREHASSPVNWPELEELVEVMAGDVVDDSRQQFVDGLAGAAFVHGLLLWEGGLLEEFLDDHAPLLPADELDLARRWVGAPLDLWEITDLRVGEGLTLLGLYRGQSVDVREVAFSHEATVGQTILARVLDAVDHKQLPAVWPIDMALREYLLTEVIPRDPDHFEWAAVMAPRRIQMRNGDGHELVHHRVSFTVGLPTPDMRGILDQHFEPDDDGWLRLSDADTILGQLHLDGDSLVVTTNSAERHRSTVDVLRDLFGDGLTEVDREVTPLASTIPPPGGLPGGPGTSPDDLPPEVLDAVRQQIRQAEDRWVDEPVPALGGMTPRDALDDPTRRGDLLALLDEFDRQPAPASGLAMRADALRELLGLPVD